MKGSPKYMLRLELHYVVGRTACVLLEQILVN